MSEIRVKRGAGRNLLPWAVAALIVFVAWTVARKRFAPPPVRLSASGSEAPAQVNEGLIEAELKSSEQIAVLALDGRDAAPAARALRAAGLSYAVVADPAVARRSRMIVIPLDDRAAPLDEEETAAYERWVSSGGVLVLQAPAGGDLWRPLTGLSATFPARTRRGLELRPVDDPGLAAFPAAEDRRLTLAAAASSEAPWTTGLRPAPRAADVLAVFDDREGALTRRRIGEGRVYVLGASIFDLHSRPLSVRHFDASSDPKGGAFESGADFAPDLLRAWAASAFPGFVRLRSLPGRATAVLCVSHDLGDEPLDAAGAFAAAESSAGVRATWFTRTGPPAFDARRAGFIRGARDLGHEIGSRGEVLPPDFDALPLGDGAETPRSYSPRADTERSWNATLLGETLVSRARLKAQTGADVVGFRGPPDSRPVHLDAALERAGYLYDAGLTAAEALTHRPFRMPAQRGFARESSIIAMPTGLPARADGAYAPARVLELLARVAEHEGVLSWNVQPDRAGLVALTETLSRLPPGTAVMTLREAALRADERLRTRFRVEREGEAGPDLLVELPEGGATDLSFEIRGLRSCQLLSAPDGASALCADGLAVVSGPSAGILRLRLNLE